MTQGQLQTYWILANLAWAERQLEVQAIRKSNGNWKDRQKTISFAKSVINSLSIYARYSNFFTGNEVKIRRRVNWLNDTLNINIEIDTLQNTNTNNLTEILPSGGGN